MDETFGKMGIELVVGAATGAFFTAVVTKVIPANLPLGTAILVSAGGTFASIAIAKQATDVIYDEIQELSDSFASIKESMKSKKEAEA